MHKSLIFALLFSLLAPAAPAKDDYTGTYRSAPGFAPITLELKQDAQGKMQGVLSTEAMTLGVQAVARPPGISGTMSSRDMKIMFSARLQENQLVVTLVEVDQYGRPDYEAAETLILQRQGPAAVQSATDRKVVINGVTLITEQVRSLERKYGVKIQDGTYWYDKICGAWGLQGGPTAGFILPGLNLGGPMRPDASNGNTGVFINGRQLHSYDFFALQQLFGAVIPGRYWLDARGNVGVEGGPPLFNIVALASNARGRGQSGSTYRSNITGGGGGGSYVMGKDWAVMVGQ